MNTHRTEILACYLYIIGRHGYPPPGGDSLRHLEEFSDLGFTSIELEGIRDKHLQEVFDMRFSLREKIKELGLEVPVFCIVLPGLSSADGKERERNLEGFKKGCELASFLGAGAVLDNSPIPPWQFPEGIPVTRHYDDALLANATLPGGLDWKKYRHDLAFTYRDLCDIAGNHRLTFHLHPCNGALVATSEAYLRFHEQVKRDNLRFNFDTANLFYLRENLSLSLLNLAGHIDYIHISDNRGQRVEHLLPGEGAIEWDRFFETLDRIRFRGRFGVDVGGAESEVPDYGLAYRQTALWLEEKWFKRNIP